MPRGTVPQDSVVGIDLGLGGSARADLLDHPPIGLLDLLRCVPVLRDPMVAPPRLDLVLYGRMRRRESEIDIDRCGASNRLAKIEMHASAYGDPRPPALTQP